MRIKQRHLKIFRIVISMLFLLAIGILFIDFREFIPPSWMKWILYPQFVPSLIRFVSIPALIATGFILILAFTFLFGRIYCSAFCPLGALQDLFSFLSKKTGLIKRYKFRKAFNFLRYSILILTVIFLLFGSLFFLNLLDPYSVFGRICSDLIRPGIVVVNNFLASQLEKFEVYSLFPFDLELFSWKTLFIPVAFFMLITWLSLYYGRLYCNTLCPVGTTLGLLSHLSLFKIKINDAACTRCGKCAFVCKSNCIDIKNQKVDFSRCVACFNCLASCQDQAILYKSSLSKKTKHAVPTDTAKRNFISKSAILGLSLAGLKSSVIAGLNKQELPGEIPNNKQHPVSPPGSISLQHFTQRCTACHLCVSACPTKVIQPSLFEYGWLHIMQPHMDYTKEYCNYECNTCSQVCPTGAIMPLSIEKKKQMQIGTVNLHLNKCVVITDHTACGLCSDYCPTQAVRMTSYTNDLSIPELESQYCIGCGACEYVCPVEPYPAIYVEGNTVHQTAISPEQEPLS